MSNGGGVSPSYNGGSRMLGGGGGNSAFVDPPNSSYGMGGSVARMEPRHSPSNFASNGYGSGGGGGGGFGGGGQSSSSRNFGGINGFESSMSNSAFESRGGFDRSISQANGFAGDHNSFGRGNGGGGSSSYDRQMSAPNLREQYGSSGGGYRGGMGSPVNDHRGDYGGRGGGGGNFYVGDRHNNGSSPPLYGKHDAGGMKIGTWNSVSTSSGGGGGGYGGGGGGSGNGGGMNFEIGTFNIGNFNSNSESGGGGGYGNGGSSSSNTYNSQSGNNIQGGPGIRETGIIEKLLVRKFEFGAHFEMFG